MFTKAAITAASTTLDETDVQMWLALIRNSQRYRTDPTLIPDLEERLTDADGTVKAQQLNVAMAAIAALGAGEVRLSGGDDGLQFSQTAEREALVSYAISVLYDTLAAVPQVPGSSTSATVYGAYGVAQRELEGYCWCCGFVHKGRCYDAFGIS